MSKVAFLFPGQGSQSVGMGKSIYDNNEKAKAIFDLAATILDNVDIRALCFEGSEDDLKKTENTQPALVVTSIACYEALKSKGISGEYFAGHSLGEITALAAAGMISFEDALKIARKRGELMAEVGGGEKPFGMAAVLGLKCVDVLNAIEGSENVVVANHNALEQIVVSGYEEDITKVTQKILDAGAKRVVPLKVSGAFHSPFMKSAADKFNRVLEDYTFYKNNNKVIANVTADIHTFDDITKRLYEQMFSTVRWYDTMIKFNELGITNAYECGPGKVLTGLMKKAFPEINTVAVYDDVTLESAN